MSSGRGKSVLDSVLITERKGNADGEADVLQFARGRL